MKSIYDDPKDYFELYESDPDTDRAEKYDGMKEDEQLSPGIFATLVIIAVVVIAVAMGCASALFFWILRLAA